MSSYTRTTQDVLKLGGVLFTLLCLSCQGSTPEAKKSTHPSPTTTATLTWNPVTSTAVSGYKVYVGEAPRLYTRTINVGTATSSTVTDLTVGKTYYFVVTALNDAGESAPSNEVSKTIQ